MAGKKLQESPLFQFFLYSMIALSVSMGGLTLFTYIQLKKQKKELFFQQGNLEELREKIQSPQFRALLERKKKAVSQGANSQFQIKKLINQIVNRQGTLRNIGYSVSNTDQKGVKKESYTIQLANLTLKGLVECLYYLEYLPGAKIENLFLEKKGGPRPWEAHFTLAIFRGTHKS